MTPFHKWGAACALALAPLAEPTLPAAPSSVQGDAADARDANDLARSLDPDSPVALEELSGLMGEGDLVDDQVAYMLLAIDAYDRAEFEDEDQKAAKLKQLGKSLKKLDSGLTSLGTARESYLRDLTWALKLYAQNQQKLWNALEVGERILSYRPDHPTGLRFVQVTLDQLPERDRTRAERLLWQRDLNRPRSFLTQWAREHSSWSDAGVFDSEHYRVRTNAGYDVGQKACKSLEAISSYFNDFYGVNRGLVQGRTDVVICRTRAEFEAVANNPITASPGLLAFISSRVESMNGSTTGIRSTVYGFDPRDTGRTLSSLWPTLWHEASHQYMLIAAGGKPTPLWINEGMSTYFESVQFSSSGQVSLGLPVMGRLGALVKMLKDGQRPLEELTRATDALTGEQYAAACGLVYYLRHGRDDQGKKLRPRALDECLAAIGRGLVTGPGLFAGEVLSVHGQSLEEFEDEWKAAMLALHAAELQPSQRALSIVDLGQLRLENGDVEDALTLFSEARLRDPQCLPAIQATTDVYFDRWKSSKKKDRLASDLALASAREEYRVAGAAGEEEAQDRAEDRAKELDGAGFAKIKKAEDKYTKKVEKLLARLIERGRPKTAIAVARIFMDDVLGTTRSASLAAELRTSGVLTLKRRYLPFNGTDLNGLTASASSFRVSQGKLAGTSQRPAHATLTINRKLTPLFTLEGSFYLEDPSAILSLIYSDPREETSSGVALRPKKHRTWKTPTTLYEPFDAVPFAQWAPLKEAYSPELGGVVFQLDGKPRPLTMAIEARKWHRFHLDGSSGTALRLSIDDQLITELPLAQDAPGAQLGLLVYGGEVQFEDLEAAELDQL